MAESLTVKCFESVEALKRCESRWLKSNLNGTGTAAHRQDRQGASVQLLELLELLCALSRTPCMPPPIFHSSILTIVMTHVTVLRTPQASSSCLRESWLKCQSRGSLASLYRLAVVVSQTSDPGSAEICPICLKNLVSGRLVAT